MCAAGAVEGLIRTDKEWSQWLVDHPGQVYEDDYGSGPPFYVISRVVSDEGQPAEYMHHVVDARETAAIIGDKPAPEPFNEVGMMGRISGVLWQTVTEFTDDRGHLVELFRKDELQKLPLDGGPRVDFPPMAYLSVTKPGVVRGPHEHLTQTDIFIFCRSKFDIFLWDNRPKSETHWVRQRLVTLDDQYYRLVIPPGVVHAYRAVGKDGLVVNCPDKLFAGWDKSQPVDEIRHETDPASPFQLWGD